MITWLRQEGQINQFNNHAKICLEAAVDFGGSWPLSTLSLWMATGPVWFIRIQDLMCYEMTSWDDFMKTGETLNILTVWYELVKIGLSRKKINPGLIRHFHSFHRNQHNLQFTWRDGYILKYIYLYYFYAFLKILLQIMYHKNKVMATRTPGKRTPGQVSARALVQGKRTESLIKLVLLRKVYSRGSRRVVAQENISLMYTTGLQRPYFKSRREKKMELAN